MTHQIHATADLSDAELLFEVKAAASRERVATAQLVALLAEVDVRRLYLGEGCSSLFTYCTQVVRLSEHAAYGRIEAARAAVKCPLLLERLAEGSVTLTAVTLLAPHLTPENCVAVLDEARHKTKRDVEHTVARLRPQLPVPTKVRMVSNRPPVPVPIEDRAPVVAPCPHSIRPSVIQPLAPERYKVQFTISRETYDQLRKAQDLLRTSIPNGDPSAIFARALNSLVGELEKTKFAATGRPRPARPLSSASRHIPASVKREVWRRDGGQCAYVGAEGRCRERSFLEYHHVVPYVDGGPATTANIQLRCRAHNLFEAEALGLFVREHPTEYTFRTA
jgi:hypothetical protein